MPPFAPSTAEALIGDGMLTLVDRLPPPPPIDCTKLPAESLPIMPILPVRLMVISEPTLLLDVVEPNTSWTWLCVLGDMRAGALLPVPPSSDALGEPANSASLSESAILPTRSDCEVMPFAAPPGNTIPPPPPTD